MAVAIDKHHGKMKEPNFFMLLGWSAPDAAGTMCSIWAKETITASRGHVSHRTPSHNGKAVPRIVSAINRSRLIAAAAASTLLLLAVPAEAGCSKSVVMYNASWCPYCRQVRAILARNHIKYTALDATTSQVQEVMLLRFGDTAVPRTVIGGVVVEGVDEARIRQLCR
jgi:glutaredoxin